MANNENNISVAIDCNITYHNAVNVGVKRVTDIVSSLNHYSRRDDLPLNTCNINSIIDNCLVMLNNQFKDRIEVIKEYTGVPHIIFCSEGKLHQALINIIQLV